MGVNRLQTVPQNRNFAQYPLLLPYPQRNISPFYKINFYIEFALVCEILEQPLNRTRADRTQNAVRTIQPFTTMSLQLSLLQLSKNIALVCTIRASWKPISKLRAPGYRVYQAWYFLIVQCYTKCITTQKDEQQRKSRLL